MNNLKKNFWSKAVLGILVLGFVLAPLGVHEAQAVIKQIKIQDVTQADITPQGVKLKVDLTGQPIQDQKLYIEISHLVVAGGKETHNIPTNLIDKNVASQTIKLPLQYDFKAGESYSVAIYIPDDPNTQTNEYLSSNVVSFKGDGSAINNNANNFSTLPPNPQIQELDIGCSVSTIFTNCVVAGLYFIVYEPLAEITTLSAKFLDFFVYYSISSDAYRSGFVEKAWSVVRDISNMLFIIALLYIAIKTILQMNTSNQQRLLGFIIGIALVINFSLFVSRVVIDASNILARVFYNNITPYDENGVAIPPDSNKPKSVSVGLVRTFDPQNVISNPRDNLGNFALVTILFIALLFYMILMFISISMLFVGRVAALWIAMMFSPLAFISAAVPFKIPKFGWSEWWGQLIKSAMMAPIFAFFLYIIILFAGFLTDIQYDVANTASSATGWLDALMKNVIPFILIFVLLKEAKAITKDYAGEMGKTFSDWGSKIGGLAVGATAGIAAFGGKQILGRAGSWMERNHNKDSWIGRNVTAKLGRRMSTASYDARTGFVGKQLSKSGLQNLNTLSAPKTGGYAKIREDAKKKREKRAEEISKVGYNEKESKKLREAEVGLQTIMNRFSGDIEKLNDRIKGAREEANDAQTALNGLNKNTQAYRDQQAIVKQKTDAIGELKEHKKALRNGGTATITKLTDDTLTGNQTRSVDYTGARHNGDSIATYEDKIIPKRKKDIKDKERDRKLAYAKTLNGQWWSDGAQEVAHKIRSGASFEDKGA